MNDDFIKVRSQKLLKRIVDQLGDDAEKHPEFETLKELAGENVCPPSRVKPANTNKKHSQKANKRKKR